jgi:hypothetical protein
MKHSAVLLLEEEIARLPKEFSRFPIRKIFHFFTSLMEGPIVGNFARGWGPLIKGSVGDGTQMPPIKASPLDGAGPKPISLKL